jgi:2,4-dienoyl-CoA reductase-like NADH-dependent reductase (Old Yellow Enzyme family)
MPSLFEPLTLRGLTFRNRIFLSPMCQYSSRDGFTNDWHIAHLGARAVGGAGLLLTEATAVSPEGRISPADLGLWKDEHILGLGALNDFVHSQGATIGVQLAHAGRKASTDPSGGRPLARDNGAWTTFAPSPLPFDEGFPVPQELGPQGIEGVVRAFQSAARRADKAGFDLVEIHAAHGYLLHQFLSPLTNRRTDVYGGSFENRTRLVREVVSAVRKIWPEEKPLFVRVSATDWLEPDGWTLEQTVLLARELKGLGVDLIDASSGGLMPGVPIPVAPGYQVPFASRLRQEAQIATGAVGLITDAQQADAILREGHSDAVLIGREFLRDPSFPLHAAQALGVDVCWIEGLAAGLGLEPKDSRWMQSRRRHYYMHGFETGVSLRIHVVSHPEAV